MFTGTTPSGISNPNPIKIDRGAAYAVSTLFRLIDAADPTKQMTFTTASIATGATITVAPPAQSGAMLVGAIIGNRLMVGSTNGLAIGPAATLTYATATGSLTGSVASATDSILSWTNTTSTSRSVIASGAISLISYGSGYATAGLLVANLTSLETTSAIGLLMNIGSGGTYWWCVNSTTTATMTLTSTNLSMTGNVKLTTAGNGLYVKEGTNATMGRATLVAGTVTVSTTKALTTSEIFLTVQSLGGVAAPVGVAVTARVNATSFTITSASALDTSVVSWIIIEPS